MMFPKSVFLLKETTTFAFRMVYLLCLVLMCT